MRIRPGLRQIDLSGNFTVFPRMRLSGSHRAVAPGGCAVASVVQVQCCKVGRQCGHIPHYCYRTAS